MTPRRTATVVGGLLMALVLVTVPAARGMARRSAAGALAPCALATARQSYPSQLALGAATSITFAMSTACAPITRPLHVVLVLDASAGMKDYLTPLQDTLTDALADLAGPARPWLAFGVVSFAEGAEVKRALTSNVEHAIAGVRDVRIGGANATAEGLQGAMREALRMLPGARPARSPEEIAAGPREVILVASGGVDPGACDRVRTQAVAVQGSGVLLATACVGPNCDRQCLAEAASWVSGRRFAFRSWSSWAFLTGLLTDLVLSDGPFFAPIERITVQDQLHENLLYEGGGNPSHFDGNRLAWSFAPWTDTAVTRTYRVRAAGIGRYRVSRSVTATVHFNGAFWPGLTHTVDLANPVVEVVDPAALTPTATSASTGTPTAPAPSATPTLTDPATVLPPTVTPTPLSSPGDRLRRLYLPTLARWACAAAPRPADVALLLDVSGSMGLPATGYPGSRRDAARAVARQLLATLGPADQVMVVQYGGQPDVLAPLAPCCAAAQAGLDRLGKVNGTRLELAVAAAMRELAGPGGRANARRAMVFFTDGDLNQTDRRALADDLDRARSSGVTTYAVAASDTADEVVLDHLAGTAARVYLPGRDGLAPAHWPGGAPPGCD